MKRPPPAILRGEEGLLTRVVGLALLVGGVGVVIPFLDGLVLALVSLALLTAVLRSSAAGGRHLDWHALAIVAVGFGGFLFLPGHDPNLRGFSLALSAVPLWWTERPERTHRP